MANKLIKHNEPFGTAPNSLLNSKEASLKAKGLYAYLNSKPDGWNFSIRGISSQIKEGKVSIQGAIKELEEINYLRRKPIQGGDGKYRGWDYLLYEKPAVGSHHMWEDPLVENLVGLSKKEESKKEEVSKKESLREEIVDISQKKVSGDDPSGAEVNVAIDVLSRLYPSAIKTIYERPVERKKVAAILKAHSQKEFERVVDAYKALSVTDKFAPKKANPSFFLSDFDGVKTYVDSKAPRPRESDDVEPDELEKYIYLGALSHETETPLLDSITRDLMAENEEIDKPFLWVRTMVYLAGCQMIKYWMNGDRVYESMKDFYWHSIKLFFWDYLGEGKETLNVKGEKFVWDKTLEQLGNYKDYNPSPYKDHYPFIKSHPHE